MSTGVHVPERRGVRRALLTTLLLVTAWLVAAPSASAAEQNAYAAAMNYATPTIQIGQGDTLTFHNLDNLAKHDLLGTNGKFGSDLIGAGESSKVKGVESLDPGQYQFHCSLHGWMQGVLNVGPRGSGAPGAGGGEGGGGGAPASPAGQVSQDPYDVYAHATKGAIGDASWPFYGHDLANTRDGGADGPGVAEVPNLGVAWSFYSREGDFTGTPVVANGMVIAGSNGGTVYAIDATTGRQRWAHRTGKVINGTVAVSGNRVFVPIAEPHEPKLLALSLKTGRPLWITQLSDQKNSDVYGSPVVWNGRVYQGVSALYGELGDPDVNVRGQVLALSAKTGKIKWNTYMVPPGHDGGAVWTTPAIDTKTGILYVGTGNAYHEPAADTTDAMVALNAKSGAIVNKFQATAGDVWNGTSNAAEGPDYDFGASPQLFTGPDGRQLVGEGQKAGVYHALDRSTMEPVWQRHVGPGAFVVGGVIGSTATDGRRIYGPSTVGGEMWSVGIDGGYQWFSTDGGPLKFNATSVANGVVYTTDMTGYLVAREAATGLVLNRIPLGGPSWGGVSVAGKTVFAAVGTQSSEGYIAAYRVRQGGEETAGAEHYEDKPEQDPDEYLAAQEREEKCAQAKRKLKQAKSKKAKRKWKKRQRKYCPRKKKKKAPKPAEGEGHHNHAGGEHDQDQSEERGNNEMEGQGGAVLKASRQRGDRYVPKAPGTTENLSLYYGPYTIPPGWDANRIDLELPTQNGFLIALEPAMRRVGDLSEPMHTEAHIHHAHWFGFDPGNAEDNYFNQLGPGTHEWVFGNGDEETRADFRRRTAAEPGGPVYGNFIPAGRNQTVIYMLHNKTNQPMEVWIVLDVVWQHGTRAQLEAATGRQYHDVNGMLMGRTFNVPREPGGDGEWVHLTDRKDCPERSKRPEGCVIEWVAPRDGTIIGSGGHLHPGGTDVIAENYGTAENPCPADKRGRGYGGTLLYHSDIINRNAPLSEDYQTEVTHPAWRAPLRKGDRIRITGIYTNEEHAWYYAMIHAGFYFDYEQPPKGRCKPYIVGPAKKKVKDPTSGVPNRPWTMEDEYCGWKDAPACEKPEEKPKEEDFAAQNVVHIASFQYLPGDRSSAAAGGKIPSVKQGEQITFVNDDQFANIRHTVTTCPWPCNGRYVANYPHADGAWDSNTLGYDPIDGGTPNPRAQTPADLKPGLYTYFCRIHPWMRGAFRIEPAAMGSGGASGLTMPGG
jgi:polyvinyl alcohol dehydrogenase (cytochrome)